MKVYHRLIEVTIVILMCIVPWPGPTVFKISCPRNSAAMVRKLVQKRWIPVLDKYQVKLPLECPFHPKRDIFQPQEAAKRHSRSQQWTCAICGKSFYEEKYLDMHFHNKHRDEINMAEDAVCLADYCDMMRCEVIQSQEMKQTLESIKVNTITDLEVWQEPNQRSKALSIVEMKGKLSQASNKQCHGSEIPLKQSTVENISSEHKCDGTLVDSMVPPKKRLIELQKLKANCKPEELLKLKHKCETLIRDCIAGLLVNLSTQDFKDIERELNNAFCWYLTCDRYWQDVQNKSTKTQVTVMVIFVMTALMMIIILGYYVIWIIYKCDREIDIEEHQNVNNSKYTTEWRDENKDNYYVYVTYPADVERRLLDSYNRTTRL